MTTFLDGTLIALLLALLLDHLLGEARRWHPLVGFGKLAQRTEALLNKGSTVARCGAGAISVILLIAPACYLVVILRPDGVWQIVFDALMVYFCLGWRSLREHTTPIAAALLAHEHAQDSKTENAADCSPALANARKYTSHIVSRDADTLTAPQCTRAAIESLLENGNDALFATLFWYVVFGPAGALLHRLSNTLDAMWGYHTPRHEWFGTLAARLDDGLAWLPARLTALSYALVGNPVRALRCWRLQARQLSSPNGGPCMTAGAGSLGVMLGGPCRYHGRWVNKPVFGEGPSPQTGDIVAAQRLLARALWLWLAVLSLIAAASPWLSLAGGNA